MATRTALVIGSGGKIQELQSGDTLGGGGGGAAYRIDVDCGSDALDYFIADSTSFLVARNMIFPGTGTVTPTTFKVIARMESGGETGTVRLYGVTNSQVIASLTLTSATKAIYTDSSLTNLPTGEAIFELQGSTTDGDTSNRISFMRLE